MSLGSYFMVFRCVPDVIADESVNVGVMTWSEDWSYATCRFTDDFSRAKAIGMKGDGEFIRHFADEVRKLCAQLSDPTTDGQTRRDIKRHITRMQGWGGAIQAMVWNPSMLPADEMIEEAVRYYMKSAVR